VALCQGLVACRAETLPRQASALEALSLKARFQPGTFPSLLFSRLRCGDLPLKPQCIPTLPFYFRILSFLYSYEPFLQKEFNDCFFNTTIEIAKISVQSFCDKASTSCVEIAFNSTFTFNPLVWDSYFTHLVLFECSNELSLISATLSCGLAAFLRRKFRLVSC
jgi:hypothetical protein